MIAFYRRPGARCRITGRLGEEFRAGYNCKYNHNGRQAEVNGIFDIIGPIMVGPSSSHTAGAVRLGLAGRAIVGGQPSRAALTLHGSFAQTYRGHGTDVALVAGILGMRPDDERIPDSFRVAREQGMEFSFAGADLGDVHPNSVLMDLTGPNGSQTTVGGSSVGGGNIVITRIDRFNVDFTGTSHALIASYRDQPGVIAKITSLLATEDINIAAMRVSREGRHGRALAIIELDQPVSSEARALITRISGIDTVIALPPVVSA
jgi:L-serine dehydratase